MITLEFAGTVHPTIELTLVPVQTEGPGPTEYVVRCNGDKIGLVFKWGETQWGETQWRAELSSNPIPLYGKPRRGAVELDVCPENAVIFAFKRLTGIWFACHIRRPEYGE